MPQFDCVKPSEVVPFDNTPALVAYNAHAEAAKAGGAGAGPPTLDDSYGPPKRKSSFLQKVKPYVNVCYSLVRLCVGPSYPSPRHVCLSACRWAVRLD